MNICPNCGGDIKALKEMFPDGWTTCEEQQRRRTMNTKVDELVEWVKSTLNAPSKGGYDEWLEKVAKKILSHPDLGLIDRNAELPPLTYDKPYTEREKLIGATERQARYKMLKAGFKKVITLAEALKEAGNGS